MFLLLAACTLQNELGNKDDAAFDPGDSAPVPPDTDVEDSGETADTDPTCPSRDYPAEAVGVEDVCTAAPGELDFVKVWMANAVGEVMTTPLVAHLDDEDGDGAPGSEGDVPEVIVVGMLGELFVLSGTDGLVKWSAPSVAGVAAASAAVGDLDGDGWAEVVVGGLYGTAAYHGEGGDLMWNGAANAGQCGGLALADLDGDGAPEVLTGGAIMEGATGLRRAELVYGSGSGDSFGLVIGAMGVAADLDGDGDQEAVTGNAAYAVDGEPDWYNEGPDGWVAVGNFDGDDGGEIASAFDGNLRLLDDDGEELWRVKLGKQNSGPPTVVDVDGDGTPEIGVSARWTYTLLDAAGAVRWSSPIDDSSSGSAVGPAYDFDGDGVVEFVVADENDVWFFDGQTGAVRLRVEDHNSNTCGESATIADVDGDGSADVLYANNGPDETEHGVTLLSSASRGFRPAREVWNQHAYGFVNIEEDGTVPAVPERDWSSWNAFRVAGPTERLPGVDLLPVLLDVCEVDCDAGRLTVWAAVANRGPAAVDEAVELELWGLTDTGELRLGAVSWGEGVASGRRTEGVELTVEGVPRGLRDLELRVVTALPECDEENNVASWGAIVCP